MPWDQIRPLFTRRRALISATAAVAAAGMAACEDRSAPVDDQGRIRLRFATDSRAHAGHGGFYQALALGAYAKRGLNVQIIQGGPAVNVPQLLASGAAELGMGSSSFVALSLVQEGAPVKAVAAFFQRDPQALLAHPDPQLESIADLAGRPFLLSDAARSTWWPWLMARYGLAEDQLRPHDETPASFLADRRAVRHGYVTSEPFAIRREGGFDPRVFLLADDGYESYANLVLAPNGFARDNGAALRSFVAASAEGWRDYTNGDPRAANTLIRRDNPDMTDMELDQAKEAMNANGLVEGGDAALYGLGAMTTERWQAFFESVSAAGVYPPNLGWRDAFTNSYLPGRG